MEFTEFMSQKCNDLRSKYKNYDRRKKHLYLISFISILIVIVVVIVYFSCSSNYSYKTFDDFNEECLKSHNYYRSLHGVEALTLDETLIKVAKERAEYLVLTDVFEHPKYEFNFGENLHYIMPFIKTYSCIKVVKPWYDEIKDYNYLDWRKSSGKIGHFTQVVWKSTNKVGCAQAYSDQSHRLYTVCNYSPAGNYINKYNHNVLLPLSKI